MLMSAETKVNPYASTSTAFKETGFDGVPKERSGRNFRFNPKGKYVHLAEQLRQEEKMEALKQRIAETARKAGLDSEFETLEKNIRVRDHFATIVMSTQLHLFSVCHHPQPNGGMLHSCRTSRTMTSNMAFCI
jgi:hypothetical protein